MTPVDFQSRDERDTARLGAALAEALPPGTTVALLGTLGAGKTRLVQAIALAVGVPEGTAVSPTFVLVQEYRGRIPVFHIDAYRVADDDEFWALGPDEYFEGPGLTLIEWADRVAGCLPSDRLEIEISVTGPETRRFEIRAIGPSLEAAVDQLRGLLENAP